MPLPNVDIDIEVNLPAPAEAVLLATLQPGVQFGITMMQRPSDGLVAVKTVDAGCAAEAQGVRVGFLVREVGSKSCSGLSTVEVIDLFKTVRRPCRLKLSHAKEAISSSPGKAPLDVDDLHAISLSMDKIPESPSRVNSLNRRASALVEEIDQSRERSAKQLQAHFPTYSTVVSKDRCPVCEVSASNEAARSGDLEAAASAKDLSQRRQQRQARRLGAAPGPDPQSQSPRDEISPLRMSDTSAGSNAIRRHQGISGEEEPAVSSDNDSREALASAFPSYCPNVPRLAVTRPTDSGAGALADRRLVSGNSPFPSYSGWSYGASYTPPSLAEVVPYSVSMETISNNEEFVAWEGSIQGWERVAADRGQERDESHDESGPDADSNNDGDRTDAIGDRTAHMI